MENKTFNLTVEHKRKIAGILAGKIIGEKEWEAMVSKEGVKQFEDDFTIDYLERDDNQRYYQSFMYRDAKKAILDSLSAIDWDLRTEVHNMAIAICESNKTYIESVEKIEAIQKEIADDDGCECEYDWECCECEYDWESCEYCEEQFEEEDED